MTPSRFARKFHGHWRARLGILSPPEASPAALRRKLALLVKLTSQVEVARAAGIAPTAVSNVLSGKILPSGKLLKFLGYKKTSSFKRI